MRTWLLVSVTVAMIGANGVPARAQEAEGPAEAASGPTGPAAFLFAYHIKDGMMAQFEEGYRRHLEWHREHGDPLPWYGWYVTSGDRPGLFIDGTFGISFQAFDERVEPRADFADMMETTLPFVTPAFFRTYRLRPELGTGQPLEDRTPTRSVQTFHFAVSPGMEPAFEAWAARIREAAGSSVLTWYELVAGGEHPSYMLHVSRAGWADVGAGPGFLATILGDDRGRAGTGTDGLEGVLRGIRSEVWTYRPDLSLIEP